MTDAETLKSEVKTLVFDQYGTIVDMQSGLVEIVAPFLKEAGWDGSAHRFVTWWRRTHFENSMIDALCGGDHTPYRVIGERAVSHVMDRAGISYTAEQAARLVSRIEELKPFDDVVDALRRLRGAGYRLATLSNGDPDMLEAAKPHIDFAFDATISVQETGAFKPHWKTYAKAEELLGEDRRSILFVANHPFDCVGAKSYGMHSCFIDRRKQPFGHWPEQQPDLSVDDFKQLAETLV